MSVVVASRIVMRCFPIFGAGALITSLQTTDIIEVLLGLQEACSNIGKPTRPSFLELLDSMKLVKLPHDCCFIDLLVAFILDNKLGFRLTKPSDPLANIGRGSVDIRNRGSNKRRSGNQTGRTRHWRRRNLNSTEVGSSWGRDVDGPPCAQVAGLPGWAHERSVGSTGHR